MINKEITDIAKSLQNVVSQQMQIAQDVLAQIPEGEIKSDLTDLLKRASSGKISHLDAQKQVQKIVKKYAGTN